MYKLLTKNKKFKYIFIGGINTIIGYMVGLLIYSYFSAENLAILLLIINVINISISFLSYKIIVFGTRGNWLIEYLKCYLVYGFGAIASAVTIYIMVEHGAVKFWIAQAIALILVVFSTYILHDKFTFKLKK